MRFIYFFLLLPLIGFTQVNPYTSYFTGDTSNVNPATNYGICLMGGATEDDNAMKWFLNRSGGGDIVVIRVTGTSGYNTYLYTTLGITVNSVETLVIPSIAAANHPYIRRRLREAEAVFIAGGNQFDYISYWKNTAVDSALNYLIKTKKVPIGGTSAGMAVQGQAYYSAAAGSVTSPIALANPYGSQVTIGNNDFIKHPLLKRTITDTHYDNPDRRGRQSTFLAKLFQDSSVAFNGIACDEYTAVCIDSTGIAKVFGGFPQYDDNAYFITPNCILPNSPENCINAQPLTWNRNGEALKVYAIKGTAAGSGTVNVKTWQSFAGGNWQNWWVLNGVFNATTTATGLNCSTTSMLENSVEDGFSVYPNPTSNVIMLQTLKNESFNYSLTNLLGEVIISKNDAVKLDIGHLPNGIYLLQVKTNSQQFTKKIIKQ
jgi:cyanophycinase-like exopeptidase